MNLYRTLVVGATSFVLVCGNLAAAEEVAPEEGNAAGEADGLLELLIEHYPTWMNGIRSGILPYADDEEAADDLSDIEGEEGEEAVVPESSNQKPPETPSEARSPLARMAKKLSLGASFNVYDKNGREVTLSFRYTRTVEFNSRLNLYELIEIWSFSPEFKQRWNGFLPNIGFTPSFRIAKPYEFVFRQAKFQTWKQAAFGPFFPQRHIPTLRRAQRSLKIHTDPETASAADRKRSQGALEMDEGEAVTLAGGLGMFYGLGWGHDLGIARAGASLGVVLGSDYNVTIERPHSNGGVEKKGWQISIFGSIQRGWKFSVGAKTDRILIRKFRLIDIDADWIKSRRYLLSVGPVDLNTNGSGTELLIAVLKGRLTFPEVTAFGKVFRPSFHRDITLERLQKAHNRSGFSEVFERVINPENPIPWTTSLVGLRKRGFNPQFWFFLDWDSDAIDETAVALRGSGRTKEADLGNAQYYDHITVRRKDRGVSFMAAESHDLKVVTVADGFTREMYTEASYDKRDGYERRKEGLKYNDLIRRFITPSLLTTFDPAAPEIPCAEESRVLKRKVRKKSSASRFICRNGLPDLANPRLHQPVTFNLRMILGPKYHPSEEELKDIVQWEDESWSQERRRVRMARMWHRVFRRVVFHGADLEPELAVWNAPDDRFLSFRVDIEPPKDDLKAYVGIDGSRTKLTESFRGTFGDPSKIGPYHRLSTLFGGLESVY